MKLIFSPKLKWFNNTIEQPAAANPKNNATLEASLSPERNVTKAPTKSIINIRDTFIVYIIELKINRKQWHKAQLQRQKDTDQYFRFVVSSLDNLFR